MLIQPIETIYRGFRFRSRTEARWAVFFDCLGIEFFYEPEGYHLPNGEWYLPDFHFPQIHAWGEVKGTAPTGEEMIRCEQLAEGGGGLVLILDGPPDFRAYVGVSNLDGVGPIWCQFSLDIDDYQRIYYRDEHRLFSDPGPITETTCTERYRAAVIYSRFARFDGTDLPFAPGTEPFNASTEDILKAWRKAAR